MLDLIVFASAVAITKYISQRNPLLSPSSSSTTTIVGDQHDTDQRSITPNNPIDQVSRYIFNSCLLISLLLFSLSILEAAPISWLVMIDRASLFILSYQALLWALCILLLFVHPLFLGVIVGASIFTKKPSSTIKASTAVPPSPKTNHSEVRRSRHHPLIICRNILWISIRFFLLTIVWRLLRRVMGAIIPYRITRADNGGRGGARNKRKQQYCTTGIVMTALMSLCLSFLSLATIGSLILYFDTVDSNSNHNAQHVPSIFGYISLKFMVSVICAFGMIVASILNGFGCASLPHANLVGVFLKPTSLSRITKVEEDFHYAMKTLDEKRWMLADAMSSSSAATRPPSSSFTPSKSKKSSEKQRIKQLQEEVIFLENLAGDMNDDIEEMKQSQQLALAARTSSGRIRGILGVVFSVVLVVRVILAAKSFMSILEGGDNKVNTTSNSRDPLTSISLWLLGRNIIVKTQEQYDLFRQGTSLVLAGVLSISQVRAFLRVVGALGRRLSRTCGVSFGRTASCVSSKSVAGQTIMGRRRGSNNNVALLLSSFVMGCYFLACVTVVKMTLPIEYRLSFSTAVGLNFNFNTQLLNIIFFGSACVSAITLASLFG
eukprot:CAMPEP_0202025542 /NCGR_PEP_ID=MMETSP0905-20130828/56679_1 /ASSEMBLY_ACC=CAM_ASM_000554 /TAXON_ID=420261 /ORGANISM="Thalassiosira antarctica, Strain CCMP982" /LENGTH=604 /DNA_ID=CAMNT_0048588495 /DNA_START=141 /DNA_END=1952 /DNA_ORIENTATION=-